MMNLTIETQNETRKQEVLTAYDAAMKARNLNEFKELLSKNLENSTIGQSGSHIWMHDSITNNRLGIITNLLN